MGQEKNYPAGSFAVTYHYVRQFRPDLPFFTYLDIENFNKQISWFRQYYNFPSQDDFLRCCSTGTVWDGIILTFDDGLCEHYENVLPVLKRNGLWGIFFVPTAPLKNDVILDVHKVHLVLGKLGGGQSKKLLMSLIENSDLAPRLDQRDEILDNTYKSPDRDGPASDFKRILNYYLVDDHKKTKIQ